MTDGRYNPSRQAANRYAYAMPRDGAANQAFGYMLASPGGPTGQLASSQVQGSYQGLPPQSPSNPGKNSDSPPESFASNRYAMSQKVYFPSANDLRLGAQGYSSCSDRDQVDGHTESQQPDETISRSGQGADTYAGHLPSSHYGYGDQPSPKRSSKAYGMENGNWMGMDASIQSTTLQDTTCLKNLSRDELQYNYKNRSNLDIADDSNRRGGHSEWLPMGGHTVVNRSNQNQGNRGKAPPLAAVARIDLGGDSSPVHSKGTTPLTLERNVLHALQPGPQHLKGSAMLDETLQLMNQTQNKTIYQVTRSPQRHSISRSSAAGGDYFKQVWSPRRDDSTAGPGSTTRRFNLTFKMFYKTDFGESLQVVGSVQELGAWKDYKCPLKWTEGHIWVSENLSITSCSHFTYKYVVMYQEKAVKWERGPHRIADLEILPDVKRMQMIREQNSCSASPDSRYSGKRSHYSVGMNSAGLAHSSAAASGRLHNHNGSKQYSTKTVELRDQWEQFTIRFSVFAPMNMTAPADGCGPEDSKEYMRIIGSVAELTRSGTIESGPRRMKKSRKKFRWLFDKYGQEMCPWECQVKLKASDLIDTRELIYSYSKSDQTQKDYIYEREPSRIIKFQPPETYRGELGAQKSSQWRNWDKVWIVNGHVEKVDGNFLGELFYTKVGETGICLGTYPLEDQDVQRLHQAGITGVLNIMTLNDHRQRGVQLREIQRSYQERGIRYVKFPVNDIKDKDLQSNLFIAAQHLNNMVNVLGLNVYVHCTSGLTRSPAAILAYLCLFKKIKCWQTPDEALKYIRTFNPKLNPNMRIIKKCIEANKEFQMGQSESPSQGKRLLDSLEDSFYFPNMIIEESNHNPMKLEKLLDIANQIQEEEESFDTNQGRDQQLSHRSGKDLAVGPLHNQMELSAIAPPPRVSTTPYLAPRKGASPDPTRRTNNHAATTDLELQQKIDEEVALKLNQQLDGLREQIIKEQEAKMRQAIQEAISQNQQLYEAQQKEISQRRAQEEMEQEKEKAQKKLEEEEARRLEAASSYYSLQEEASRAKMAREQEEKRARQLEHEIEQLKLREQERLYELKVEKERLEQEVQVAVAAKEARDRELQERQEREELLQQRERDAKREAEELAQRLREEMEQKMKENIEKLMKEQMRQSLVQEQAQKLREQKLEQEKKDIEELIKKQKNEEEQRRKDKLLRKLQKQEGQERTEKQLEDEKRVLNQQMLDQQKEIQKLQWSLKQEAEQIEAFERLEQSHKQPSRLEQLKREAEQREALQGVQELKQELEIEQEKQRLAEEQTARELRQKDMMLQEIEWAKEKELKKEVEVRQKQEQHLKEETESKLTTEQQAEQQRMAAQKLQLQLEREQEQIEIMKIQEQLKAKEKLEQARREAHIQKIEMEKKKQREQELQATPPTISKETPNRGTAPKDDEQSADLYYRAAADQRVDEPVVPSGLSPNQQLSANSPYTSSSKSKLSPSPIHERGEPPGVTAESTQQVYVKKRRDRRNRDRSGSGARRSLGYASRASRPQIDDFIEKDAEDQVAGAAAQSGDDDLQQKKIEELSRAPHERQGSKSSLILLAEEEQLAETERLQRIKKKKQENALRQAQVLEQEQEKQNVEEQKRQQEHELQELLHQKELERQRQEHTRRLLEEESTKAALKVVAEKVIHDAVRQELSRICSNQIEIETEVQTLLQQHENERVDKESKESHDSGRVGLSAQKDGQIARKDRITKKKEAEKLKRLQIQKQNSGQEGRNRDDSAEEQREKLRAETEAEIERIRNLRILEEEKLNLLRLTREVEDQRSILKSKQSGMDNTLNQSLEAQVQEIPDAMLEPYNATNTSKKEQRVAEDESLQLDYQKEKIFDQRERKEDHVGSQRTIKARESSNLYSAKNTSVSTEQKQSGFSRDGRAAAPALGLNQSANPSEKSFANDSALRASNQKRISMFSPQKSPPVLSDLQFEQMCDEFFAEGPPIKFRARRGVKLDEQIQRVLRKERTNLPVIHVRASLYLIGTQRCICELKGELVMVKQQGVAASQGPQRLARYLTENQTAQQRALCKLMLQSRLPIEEVCQALVNGQRIGEPKIGEEARQAPQLGGERLEPASGKPATAGYHSQGARTVNAKFGRVSCSDVLMAAPGNDKATLHPNEQAETWLAAPGRNTNGASSRKAMTASTAFSAATKPSQLRQGTVSVLKGRVGSSGGAAPQKLVQKQVKQAAGSNKSPDRKRTLSKRAIQVGQPPRAAKQQEEAKRTSAKRPLGGAPTYATPVKRLSLALDMTSAVDGEDEEASPFHDKQISDLQAYSCRAGRPGQPLWTSGAQNKEKSNDTSRSGQTTTTLRRSRQPQAAASESKTYASQTFDSRGTEGNRAAPRNSVKSINSQQANKPEQQQPQRPPDRLLGQHLLKAIQTNSRQHKPPSRVPERQIQLATSPSRRSSSSSQQRPSAHSSLKTPRAGSKGRPSPQQFIQRQRQEPRRTSQHSISLMQKAPSVAPEHQAKQINDSQSHDQQQRPLQSQRGSEASTVHRLEGRAGDYSFRSNLDLFNQEKQYQQSSMATSYLVDASHVQREQPDGNGVSVEDDEQRQERAQLGYLNALSQLAATGGGDSRRHTARASSGHSTERIFESQCIPQARGGATGRSGHDL